MEVLSFLAQARVLIVTGKGGAGKTTVSAVAANLAGRQGLRVALVQIAPASMRAEEGTGWGGAGHLPLLFGTGAEVGYDPVLLRAFPDGGEVAARALAPDTALVEYLNLHGMRRLSRRLVASGALDVVATAVPGMPDMLVLGKVKQMEKASALGQAGSADLVVLDAPAAGHAVRFLQGPKSILDAAAGGPIRGQAEEVVEMLSDPGRCQVLLVTTAEETPVSETLETARLLDERAGVHLAGVVVNARLPVLPMPDLDGPDGSLIGRFQSWAAAAGADLGEAQAESLLAAGRLRSQRQQAQAAQVARLAQELPLPRLELPFCFSSEMGPEQLDALSDALAGSIASVLPAAR
jgi:anion-transporting  ArsA/GET3 family ATPase